MYSVLYSIEYLMNECDLNYSNGCLDELKENGSDENIDFYLL